MSQLYETAQALYVTQAIVEVIRKPRAPTFKVTPKGEDLNTAFVSELSWPFYVFLVLNVASIAFGVWRYIDEPAHRGMIMFVEFWAVLDAFFLLGMLGVLFERAQPRKEPRVAHQELVNLSWEKNAAQTVTIINASMSGLQIQLAAHVIVPPLGTRLRLQFPQREQSCWASVHWVSDAGEHCLGLIYEFGTVTDERLAAAVAFGSSEQLVRNNRRRHAGRTVLGSLGWLIYISLVKGSAHLWFILQRHWSQLHVGLLRKEVG
jgi:cellulose synthase (UDP-forming)